jgi:hypothetical protein
MDYFTVSKKNKISPFQNTLAYLGGSAIQTIVDNPITAYRQLIQQYAKNIKGETISPREAVKEANCVFFKSPIQLSLSGLKPRLVGVLFKRIPKFGILLTYDFISGGNGQPGMAAATTASILSAPFINPIRMIEKQQRTSLRINGKEKQITEIIRESAAKNYKPLFRGTIPLMGHSMASAGLGLVGQPKLQKYIQTQLGEKSSLGRTASNLISSACVTPIYVFVTNPLSRLEVIMQTNSIKDKNISLMNALKELSTDMKKFGFSGVFRGQGIGIVKGIISLTLFHEGRLFLTDTFKSVNSLEF